MKPQDIALLLTGDELMSGDTVDSNSAMIAQSSDKLSDGIRRFVADHEKLEALLTD